MSALDLFGLQGKKAVVIGGGRGMGAASCRILAEAGMGVGVVDRHPERAEAVVAHLRSAGFVAVPHTADVQVQHEAEQAVEACFEGLGGLDVMVNVVGGITRREQVPRLDARAWDEMLSANLQHHFYCGAAFARALERAGHGGSMVSISSIAALEASPSYAAYGAGKAALVQLTKTMAVELAGIGLRVNCVVAGLVETGPSQRPPEEVARLEKLVPLQRLGNVDDIASCVLFLASDLSRYVTGQALVVDGGISSNPSF